MDIQTEDLYVWIRLVLRKARVTPYSRRTNGIPAMRTDLPPRISIARRKMRLAFFEDSE